MQRKNVGRGPRRRMQTICPCIETCWWRRKTKRNAPPPPLLLLLCVKEAEEEAEVPFRRTYELRRTLMMLGKGFEVTSLKKKALSCLA